MTTTTYIPARCSGGEAGPQSLVGPWEPAGECRELKHAQLSDGDLSNVRTVKRYQRRVPGGWLVRLGENSPVFIGDAARL